MDVSKQIRIVSALVLIFATGSREGWLVFSIQTVCVIVLFALTLFETRREFANQEIGHGGRQFKNIAAVFGLVFCMALLYYHHFWSREL